MIQIFGITLVHPCCIGFESPIGPLTTRMGLWKDGVIHERSLLPYESNYDRLFTYLSPIKKGYLLIYFMVYIFLSILIF